MALIILRLVFLMVAVGLGIQIASSELLPKYPPNLPPLAFGLVVVVAVAVLVIDVLIRRKRIEVITAVYFGLIIGLFLTYIVKLALTPVLPEEGTLLATYVPMVLGLALCYTCTSVLLQTKDDFRFIIPYVEFQRKAKGNTPLILDTSVIIDGRIADVVETRVLESQLVMPQFVIAELQTIADSSDKLRRNRGRRGLDVLNRLRSDKQIDMVIFDRDLPEFEGQPVDQKLVLLAKHLDGKVVTNDFNLNKVAKVQNVGVVNLNELANSLKPIFLPGEEVTVRVMKPGEETHQGVGYLEDGTMVVIENGRQHLGEQVTALVTSVLQTNAGRMVFAKFDRSVAKAAPSKPENGEAQHADSA
ncbi:PIN/TRAM domain-containing protein [Botrimarina mediterranea]|uniref:Putative PIN and TRAM-domain containing protein n=1 Tax=Botrimarina mediterranea TaxID=2528022 RepID=A0A518K3B1_9BACT|nr:PIN domain-containing protein [Botrimarina mediterranea]QDV72269.1 putative PIN and TRAM-domain containing protein precursor [Botrimarina mediterranea]QDV76813.1 putative PIN and TRAM-domain containing protein precursor [Planctomycetes bacterium K2D]